MNVSLPTSVVMVTRELNSYRVGFFETTRALLADEGVHFRLLLGGATSADRAKNDAAQLSWAEHQPTRELELGGRTLWWQPLVSLARRSDLIITEQASKQLANVPLAVMQRTGTVRHCLWGHGKNFQSSIEGEAGEAMKRWFTRSAHWFFSYTEASTAALSDSGFPRERITTFNNSTDVAQVREMLAELPTDNNELVRAELGVGNGPIVGYLGGLYGPKRTDFLLSALDELRSMIPNVEVVVIGSGVDEPLVQAAAEDRPWLHALGARYGPDRARYGATFELLLMPGLVGLNVVDGFALGLPTVTTGVDYHSPEIAYLAHGVNGWMTDGSSSPKEYALEVARLLRDERTLHDLRAGAWAAGDDLGIEAMAERFVAGVKLALNAPARGRNR